METLRGQLLIASPHLPDPNFRQTVILIIEHHEDGALGLALNRPIQTTLQELWQQVDGQSCESNQGIFTGGPVEGPIMSLHRQPDISELEVVPGVYFASERANLQTLVRDNRQPFRIYAGYSGWGAGQLENELQQGGWLIGDATDDIIFATNHSELWYEIIQEKGKDILRDSLGIDHFPDDPGMN